MQESIGAASPSASKAALDAAWGFASVGLPRRPMPHSMNPVPSGPFPPHSRSYIQS